MTTEELEAHVSARQFSLATGWSEEAWVDALNAAHWIPPVTLTNLVRSGASPSLITSLAGCRRAFVEIGDAAIRAAEAIGRLGLAYEKSPADVRGRALWLKQHRNTGPDYGHPEWR